MALTRFTYNELCMVLDYNYGLMREHEIESFDRLFIETGLAEQLFSQSAEETYQGLERLTLDVFNDGHSSVTLEPWKIGNKDLQEFNVSAIISSMDELINFFRYDSARRMFYPDGLNGYEEVGNTAYLTFDVFAMDDKVDYYEADITNTVEDTIILLMYANQQLSRENCPIENVVIDLSNNLGGAADSAMCVIAWFLGIANFSLEDMHNHSQATNMYMFDANRDRSFDMDADSVRSKNKFCLISPRSFSCGNLVPAAFKKSDMVTLIGHGSGGGACVVFNLSTADGCGFNISGRMRVNTMKNGSYISVDNGVEPDVYVTNLKNMYDLEKLTDFINGLF